MPVQSAGHLFVTQGNLANLACDAFLVPSGTKLGRFGDISDRWDSLDLERDEQGFVTPSPDRERRAIKVKRAKGLAPAVWVGHTGDRGTEGPDWYADAIRTFIRDAAADGVVPGRVRPLGDSRPVIGIPLIGTHHGGMRQRKGEVILAVIRAIQQELETVSADVVLVLASLEAYAAAQQARARYMDSWTVELADLEAQARVLGALARTDRLVLFMGAGTGVGAGLPDWRQLIEGLSESAGVKGPNEREELLALDPRDAGVVIDRRLREKQRSLIGEITRQVTVDRVSLVHQLLASLPVREAVTTNYDVLFERAWDDAGHEHTVLPRQAVRDSRRWLLKLHGSIDDPDRVVISRDDYLRFEGEGVALAGVVQAMLLTRHMLFVGYSLSDDNFHRLVHQARAALGPAPDRPGGRFGTALTPTRPNLSEYLWGDDVAFINTAADSELDVRRLAIFLDCVGQEAAAPAAHFLDETYQAVFSADELALRKELRDVRVAAAAKGVRPAVRDAVVAALDALRGH